MVRHRARLVARMDRAPRLVAVPLAAPAASAPVGNNQPPPKECDGGEDGHGEEKISPRVGARFVEGQAVEPGLFLERLHEDTQLPSHGGELCAHHLNGGRLIG